MDGFDLPLRVNQGLVRTQEATTRVNSLMQQQHLTKKERSDIEDVPCNI